MKSLEPHQHDFADDSAGYSADQIRCIICGKTYVQVADESEREERRWSQAFQAQKRANGMRRYCANCDNRIDGTALQLAVVDPKLLQAKFYGPSDPIPLTPPGQAPPDFAAALRYVYFCSRECADVLLSVN